MPIDWEARYRRAMEFALRAEAEVNRLKLELAAEKEATRAMTVVAEEALSALEALSINNQA